MKWQTRHKTSDNIPSATMADIAFLLIIFFMLTTSFSKDRVTVDLPTSFTRSELPTDSVTVSIQADGRFYWENEVMTTEQLLEQATREIQRRKSRFFIIKGDRKAPCRAINDVMQALRKAGVTNICLPTRNDLNGPHHDAANDDVTSQTDQITAQGSFSPEAANQADSSDAAIPEASP